MKVRYCLPIVVPSTTEAKSYLQNNLDKYDYFEFWLDYLQDLEIDFVQKVADQLGGRAIFLFRRLNLEPPKMAPTTRQEIMKTVAGSAALIDFDLTTQLLELRQHKLNFPEIPTIISYHNYSETPESMALDQIANQILAEQPTILKVATFCHTPADALRLLQLIIIMRERSQRFIVSGMGVAGQVTRIFGSLWGNEMVFAPLLPLEASAPGQLTLGQLQTIFEILREA